MENRTPTNPYSFGMGLSDPAMFFGRDAELKNAVDLLSGPACSCICFLGATRMGKTTLLDRTIAVLKAQGPSQPVHCVALSLLRLQDRATLFEPVVDALCDTVPNPPKPGEGAFTPDGFLKWLNKAVRNTPTVLFLDDFDDLMAPDELRFEFYNTLRAAIRGRPLAICVTSRHPLQDLCRGDKSTGSLLWNIFTTIDVGLLELEALKNLVYEPHARAGFQVTGEEWEIVLAEAGPQACLAQIAGHNLFAAKQQAGGRLGQEQLYYFSRTVHREVSGFFPVFLEYLEMRDGTAAKAARRLAIQSRVSEAETDRLVQLGMAYRTPRGPRLMSEALQKFVAAIVEGASLDGREMRTAISEGESQQAETEPAGSSFAHPRGGPPKISEHELLRRIGSGGFGEVWLARNVLGRYRAVKVMKRSERYGYQGFETEFQGLQRYEPISRSHEGLVHVLQIGRNDAEGFFYYVMELADDQATGREINPDAYAARTLAAEIVNRGRIPVVECLRLGLLLSAAIAHLHRRGLIHRDIKPGNVVFVEGAPKLADIGLVAEVGRISRAGTEGFIPPEGPGKPSADIYSLGKLLYEAMTGMSAKADFPRLPPGPSPAMRRLQRIILKACQENLQKRYQSALELQAALARLPGRHAR